MTRFVRAVFVLIGTLGLVDKAPAVTPAASTETCQTSPAAACTDRGMMYFNGQGVTQDLVKAVEFFRQACDRKDALGCFDLGVAYDYGAGVPQSRDDARTFFRKACDLKYAIGCDRYAELTAGKP